MSEPYDWLPEAREIAAQCWCDDETTHLVMETALAEAVARHVAAWMQTGAQHARNEEYWRDRALKAEAAPIVPQGWRDALQWAVDKIDAEICTHDETYRGGAIWTICRGCGAKWADDEGGLIPYTEPPQLTAARKLLAASPAPDADGVPAKETDR